MQYASYTIHTPSLTSLHHQNAPTLALALRIVVSEKKDQIILTVFLKM
jgi:hypothetical protein